MLGSAIVMSVIYGFRVSLISEFGRQGTNSAFLSLVTESWWSWLPVMKTPLNMYNNRLSLCRDSTVHHAWLRRIKYYRSTPMRNSHARTRSWYNQERTCGTALQGKVPRPIGRQEYFASSWWNIFQLYSHLLKLRIHYYNFIIKDFLCFFQMLSLNPLQNVPKRRDKYHIPHMLSGSKICMGLIF